MLLSGAILGKMNSKIHIMTTSLLNILLQADGQIYNRSWIIGLAILIVVASAWFAWNRNRKNVEKSKKQGANPDGEVIV